MAVASCIQTLLPYWAFWASLGETGHSSSYSGDGQRQVCSSGSQRGMAATSPNRERQREGSGGSELDEANDV